MDELTKFHVNPRYKPYKDDFSLSSISSYTDYELEHRHNWVQWCFPTREKSKFQPDVPVITNQNIIQLTALAPYNPATPIFLRFLARKETVPDGDHNLLRIVRFRKYLEACNQSVPFAFLANLNNNLEFHDYLYGRKT